MTKLDAALTLAARGFAVFPVKAGAKTPPRIREWQKQATTDPDTIRSWWIAHGEESNPAVHAKGLLVVDVDVRNDGNTTFDLLDMTEGFPATLTAETPSGGRHLIYRLPEGHPGVTNRAGGLGRGIDIKSTSGYIVGVGATIDGKPYRWASDVPVAPAPQWLVHRCGVFTERERPEILNVPDAPADAVDRARDWLKGRPQGDDAFATACGLRDRGLSYQQAVEALAEHDGRPLEVIEEKVAHAYRYASGAVGAKAVTADDFPTLDRAVEAPSVPTPARPTRGPLSLAEVASPTAGAQYLVKGLLNTASYAVMHGLPGEGKTFVALDIGYHVAAGRPWMDMKVRQGAVLYLAYEGTGGVRRRAQALVQHYGTGDVPLYFDDTPYNLRESEGRKALAAAIASMPAVPSLIVLDTFANALCGGDENSAQDVSAFNSGVQALIKATGACVMVIHHPKKDGTGGPRGSGALLGAVETGIEVANKEVRPVKQRDLEIGKPISFKLAPIQIGFDDEGDPITSCVVLKGDGARVMTAAGLKGGAEMAFANLCKLSPNNEPISNDQWREACEEFLPDKAANRRMAWSRIKFDLRTKGKIEERPKGFYVRKME